MSDNVLHLPSTLDGLLFNLAVPDDASEGRVYSYLWLQDCVKFLLKRTRTSPARLILFLYRLKRQVDGGSIGSGAGVACAAAASLDELMGTTLEHEKGTILDRLLVARFNVEEAKRVLEKTEHHFTQELVEPMMNTLQAVVDLDDVDVEARDSRIRSTEVDSEAIKVEEAAYEVKSKSPHAISRRTAKLHGMDLYKFNWNVTKTM